jgi:hypothetical protein
MYPSQQPRGFKASTSDGITGSFLAHETAVVGVLVTTYYPNHHRQFCRFAGIRASMEIKGLKNSC